MEQQQFQVSFSLGTKLLVSVVVLLLLVIIFLNASTIFLIKDDKRAYIYESQATEGVLAGREFVNIASHVLDTLRLSLAGIDPLRPVSPQESAAFKAVVANQTDAVWVTVGLLDPNTGGIHVLSQAGRDPDLQKMGLSANDFALTPDSFRQLLPDLERSSFAFVNLSKLGGQPVLGILEADLKFKANPAGLPIALGGLSLGEYAAGLKGLDLTIANGQGSVIFATDPTLFYSKAKIQSDPLFQNAVGTSMASGAKEYFSKGTHYLGSYTRPGLDLVVLSKSDWRKAMKATYVLLDRFIFLAGMAISAGVVFAIFFSKGLTAPLKKLYQGTREVAGGNFDLELQVLGQDEIGALTDSFNVMSKKINELIKERMEKLRLENELAIASTVQQTLIPANLFQDDHIVIRSHYQSANECGGDWWGFFTAENKISLMIADATGHGLPSALITASARSCFSVMHKLAQEDPEFAFSPSAMLSYANRVVYDAAHGKIMMTFFIGVLDFETKTLSYANAGHNPPWLFKKDASGYTLKSLMAVGQRLGESEDIPDFEEKTVEVAADDILFLYTDGLMEGKDVAGEMFGKKRTRKLVEGALAGGPDVVVSALLADFLKHNEGKSLDDDVTIAAAKILRLGPGAHDAQA